MMLQFASLEGKKQLEDGMEKMKEDNTRSEKEVNDLEQINICYEQYGARNNVRIQRENKSKKRNLQTKFRATCNWDFQLKDGLQCERKSNEILKSPKCS